jgi:hypothetical protein
VSIYEQPTTDPDSLDQPQIEINSIGGGKKSSSKPIKEEEEEEDFFPYLFNTRHIHPIVTLSDLHVAALRS